MERASGTGSGRRPIPALLTCALVWLVPLVAFAGNAAAADPGLIDHIAFAATPRVQGVGGPVTITLTVYFATDPHRNLFVNDFSAALSFGPGMTLLEGANPTTRASIEIPPTVNLYEQSFTWLFQTAEVGNQSIGVNVTTAASGSAAANASVNVREGVVLGRTLLLPSKPTTKDALAFSVAVSSGFDDPSIPLNVTLFIYESPSLATPASANGSRLRVSTGDVILGVRLAMVGQNGTFTLTLPARPRETLIYWVFVETPYNNVTSAPERAFIEDPQVTAYVSWGTLGAMLALAGIGFGWIIFDPMSRRPAAGSVHNSPDRIRPGVVLFLVGLTLFVTAVILGAVTGLWRWFGYL